MGVGGLGVEGLRVESIAFKLTQVTNGGSTWKPKEPWFRYPGQLQKTLLETAGIKPLPMDSAQEIEEKIPMESETGWATGVIMSISTNYILVRCFTDNLKQVSKIYKKCNPLMKRQ